MDNTILQTILQAQEAARQQAAETAQVLTRVDTKLTALVGEDGNGGKVHELDTRLTALERLRWIGTGVLSLCGALFGLVKLFATKR